MEARRIGEVHYRLLEVWRSLETSASFAVMSQRGGERCKPLLSPQTACASCRACIKRCWERRLGYPSTRPSSTCGACACMNFSGALQSTHISRFSTPPPVGLERSRSGIPQLKRRLCAKCFRGCRALQC